MELRKLCQCFMFDELETTFSARFHLQLLASSVYLPLVVTLLQPLSILKHRNLFSGMK